MTVTKKFKLVAISSTTNAFGLRGFVWLAADGTAYQVAGNHLLVAAYEQRLADAIAEDDGWPELDVPCNDVGTPTWPTGGWEIPNELPKPPQQVIDSVWPKAG